MALYRGNVKVSGIGQSFNPENTGTEGQVLTKTNSGYAYCDPQGGGGSDTYNIKYIVVGGGGGGSSYGSGGGGGGVVYGKQGFSEDNVSVKVGKGGVQMDNYGYCRQDGQPSQIMNNDFIVTALGGETSIRTYFMLCCTCNSYFTYKSGNGYGNSCPMSLCCFLGGGGAGGPGNYMDGGASLCGYGHGGYGHYSCPETSNCGDGGTYACNGNPGIVKICYACDGSYGFTTATGGNSCYVCDGYCVHEFTSDGTFCITG